MKLGKTLEELSAEHFGLWAGTTHVCFLVPLGRYCVVSVLSCHCSEANRLLLLGLALCCLMAETQNVCLSMFLLA